MTTLTFLQRLAITGKDRADLYRALGKTTADGLPQLEVIATMARDFARTKHPLAPLLRLVQLRLQGAPRPGAPAHRTVGSELTGLVPDQEAMLIQAGIDSSKDAEGFYNAAELVERQNRMLSTVRASLGKPVFYLAGLVAMLLFFSIKVLPGFERGVPRSRWPSNAQTLGVVADNVYWIAGGLVGAIVLGSIVFLYVAPRWTGAKREFCDRHVFPFTLYAQLSGASLMQSLACYIGAGFPIIEAIGRIQQAGSPYMASHCARVHAAARNGRRFEEGLVQLSIVDRRYHWLINVYGLASDASKAWNAIAAEMGDRTIAAVRNIFERVLSNVLLLVVGGVLMWIYTSMFGIADAASKKRAALAPTEIVLAANTSALPANRPSVSSSA
ncbi:MAG: type II secretion system F family protein [Vicinamibacterales bacterium]